MSNAATCMGVQIAKQSGYGIVFLHLRKKKRCPAVIIFHSNIGSVANQKLDCGFVLHDYR